MAERKNEVMELTESERKILEILRSMQFGEVRIIITDNKPVRIEEIKRSIKL
mgnify:CR=1 FL=1